ncbi:MULTISPECIES: hypothetical protein [Streptomyces]|uniref:Uncharacterized protein n=2 Tax=Streptomyces TaxID=1883 RepID=A0ABV6TPD7_9ACTN|nr:MULTISPECIES: hypothetical protein [Streptomyces]PKV86422.1 hypothetical protein BX283_3986 [Streptomyces sp. TLI_146]GGP35830.1 hypothetical protein GCM10010278_10470 [Streptomyces melanogenes]
MSTVTCTSAPTVPAPRGATATGAPHSPHRVGNALRACKAFAGAALSVVVLGEYSEEAGVRRRH